GGQPACVFLQVVDHPLLVVDLHLHLGWTTPPVVYVAAGLGSVVGNGLLHHADCSVLGRDAEWIADASWCVGSCSGRSCPQVYGGGGNCIRNGYPGRSTSFAEECECHRSLQRLDHRARSRRRIGMEWIPHLRYALLGDSADVEYEALFDQTREHSL